MQCPSCGYEIDADRRFGHVAVCPSCQSALVLDEDAARVSGKMAVLAKTPSPFFVGAGGTLRGRRFTVLGRIRYGYARGFWDEWYLSFDDGKTLWISEDEGNYSIEVANEVETTIDYATATPGDRVELAKRSFHIDEKDVAICEGGEGQLPFHVLSGEKTPFLDLSGDDHFATIEYDLDDPIRVFLGRRLDISDVDFDLTAEQAGMTDDLAAERGGGADVRERIVKQAGREVDIKCFSCAAPLPAPKSGDSSLQCEYCDAVLDLSLDRVTCPECGVAMPLNGGDQSKTIVCKHCRMSVDVSRHEAPAILGTLANVKRPKVPFTLGQHATFDDVVYRVIGHIRFVERDSWGVYRSDEFMLSNPRSGYRWLILENGHFSLSEELNDRPRAEVRGAPRRQGFRFDDRKWQVFETGKTTVEYVDGELPWVAQIGDENHYTDAICPPHMLSLEWSGVEAEWYQARYLFRDDVAAAFDVDKSSLPVGHGVAPHQPFARNSTYSWCFAIIWLFAVIYCVLLAGNLEGGRRVAKFNLPSEVYNAEYMTEPFEISQPDSLCAVDFHAGVDNSWVYMDVAVINDQDQALLDFSADMSYYHGYDDGAWSEGSGRDSKIFKLASPGSYRLLLMAQTGTGNEANTNISRGPTIDVAIREGVKLKRYYAAGAIILGIVGVCGLLNRWSFEKRRWGDEDDDDDD